MYLSSNHIVIDSLFSVEQVIDLTINAHVNNHIFAEYTGVISSDTAKHLRNKLANQDAIRITSVKNEILFIGYPLRVEIYTRNDIYYLHVQCISYSYQLDIKGMSQSYQDSRITHEEVLRLSYQKQGNASILMRDYQDFAIETPIFQYNETCWDFTLRMSSKVHTIAYPDILGESPQIYFGVKNTNNIVTSCYNYSEGYDTSLYLKHQLERPDIRHTDYFYCEFNSDENYQLGENLTINNWL